MATSQSQHVSFIQAQMAWGLQNIFTYLLITIKKKSGKARGSRQLKKLWERNKNTDAFLFFLFLCLCSTLHNETKRIFLILGCTLQVRPAHFTRRTNHRCLSAPTHAHTHIQADMRKAMYIYTTRPNNARSLCQCKRASFVKWRHAPKMLTRDLAS